MEQAQLQQFHRFQALQMLANPGMDMHGDDFPFDHTTQSQLNELFPAGIHEGGSIFLDQAQLNRDVNCPGRWDVESAGLKRGVTPEAQEKGELKDEDDFKLEHHAELKPEVIWGD